MAAFDSDPGRHQNNRHSTWLFRKYESLDEILQDITETI
jgi:hypothetical protein